MWNEAESEVIRLKKIFEKSSLSTEALLQKFAASSREDAKLALALIGYFSHTTQNVPYEAYIKRRLRPAVLALMEETRIPEIEALQALSPFSLEMVDEFLNTAITMNRPEVIVYFLRLKETHFGFPDRDFSL